jgi:hypothetical protein
MPILTDWDLTIDADKVLWGLGADPAAVRARRPKLVALAESVMETSRDLLAPAVLYRRFPVSELRHERLLLAGGGYLAGPLIAGQLAKASEVVVAVCTVGNSLSRQASEKYQADPVRSLALDGLASAAAETLAEAACRRFETMALAENLKASAPLNPGMIGWPLEEGQQQIFAVLDTREIGVTLGSGGIMSPLKSLSLVMGLGREMDPVGQSCDYCSMRNTCRYRDHHPS